MYKCVCCGDVTDQHDHEDVCENCGWIGFEPHIGRWHAWHLETSLWTDIKVMLGAEALPEIKFEHEFKTETNPWTRQKALDFR